MEFNQLGAKFNCNEATNAALIRQFETQSGIALPKDYADFLCYANGGGMSYGIAQLTQGRSTSPAI